jgi:hypothetical protein
MPCTFFAWLLFMVDDYINTVNLIRIRFKGGLHFNRSYVAY